jgi:hypothetical protein
MGSVITSSKSRELDPMPDSKPVIHLFIIVLEKLHAKSLLVK